MRRTSDHDAELHVYSRASWTSARVRPGVLYRRVEYNPIFSGTGELFFQEIPAFYQPAKIVRATRNYADN
jgi:hypothetical protein